MKPLRVVSFNVWSDAPRNAKWPTRRASLAKALRACRPDLAGLQEPTALMLNDLELDFPDYCWVGDGRDDGDQAGEFNPIFYREERFELLDHGTFWLADDGSKAARGWDAACIRIVTWARFLDRTNERRITHFNTHFDHFGYRSRRHSARRLLKEIRALDETMAVVVTGDFNSRESSAAYQILTGKIPFSENDPNAGLLDTHHASEEPPLGPEHTYRGFLRRFGLRRIDYIFTNRRLRTLRHEVFTVIEDSSDHFPVIAELTHVLKR